MPGVRRRGAAGALFPEDLIVGAAFVGSLLMAIVTLLQELPGRAMRPAPAPFEHIEQVAMPAARQEPAIVEIAKQDEQLVVAEIEPEPAAAVVAEMIAGRSNRAPKPPARSTREGSRKADAAVLPVPYSSRRKATRRLPGGPGRAKSPTPACASCCSTHRLWRLGPMSAGGLFPGSPTCSPPNRSSAT